MSHQLHELHFHDVSVKLRELGKKTNEVVTDLVKLVAFFLILAFVATLQVQHTQPSSPTSTMKLCHSAKGINYFCLNPNKSHTF